MNSEKGLFVVVDGLDGIGKGEVERAILDFEKGRGKRIFDVVDYSKKRGMLPFHTEWDFADLIYTAEPGYCWIGKAIRDELISKSARAAGREYSAEANVQAYSLDRLILLKMVGLPAERAGKIRIQSRCCAATWTYQVLQAMDENRDVEEVKKRILSHEGNRLQLEYRPDLLIIPTISDPAALMKRYEERKSSGKDDNAIFENLQFQLRLKPLYEGRELKELFESRGTKVVYLDAGISVEETRRQAVQLYTSFLEEMQKSRSVRLE